jgi:MoxR-like ATPase
MIATQPRALIDALTRTIVGQRDVVESLVLGLIADGHVLVEGPPGLAKTLACRSLAAALDGEFKRIQFTPDLLPADIVGTRIFNLTGAAPSMAARPPHAERVGSPEMDEAFKTVLGPIFANVVLADEINRAPAKVQSALLEAMQERQVTIGPQTHPLPEPFIVLATMNPLDADGTYALPLAQLDRFLLKVRADFPSHDEELAILERFAVEDTQPVHGAASIADVLTWRAQARAVYVDVKVKRYIVELVAQTRAPHQYIECGASPRATLALAFVARARALLDGRDFVVPDDVRSIAPMVLRHRIVYSHRVQIDRVHPDDVLDSLIGAVRAP